MALVVDASITMAWCFDDQATPDTEAILDQLSTEQAVVPALWQLEVINVLLVAERRRRITEAQAARFLELLAHLPILVDATPTDLTAVVAVGRRYHLSAYDAAYLVLAERLGAPLGTLDDKLATACRSAGVQLIMGQAT